MTKKHKKKIKGRKRKPSRRSRRPGSSRPKKKTRRLLIPGLILCLAIVGVSYFIWTLNTTRHEQKKVEASKSPTEDLLPQPAASTLTPEQEFPRLKKEEMELAQQVLIDFPNSDDAYVLMGDLSSRHGDSTEAIKLWEKALAINPNRFDVYRNMGQLARQREEFEKAVAFGRKALELQPNAPGVRSNIARALMDSGQYSEAIAELEEEIKLAPRSPTAYFQLAEVYLQQKEYDKAKKYYEETIQLEPKHSHAYHGLMTVHVRLKQRTKAKEYQGMFKKLRAKQTRAYMGRQWNTFSDLASLRASVVRTYLDAEQLYRHSGNISKAEELLKRACELEPDNTRCLERLGALYYTTRRIARALECFEQIVRIDPNNPMAHLNAGQAASRLKMFEKAERAFRQTITLAPSNPAGHRELARFYLRNNTNAIQAYVLAKKAIALEKNAETYFLLGWAADMNGDRARALQAMEQAIKLEPQNQQYRNIYEGIKAKN